MLASYGMGKTGEFFKRYRARKKLTQGHMAEKLETVKSHICAVEKGNINLPMALCKKLYVFLDDEERANLISAIKEDKINEVNQFIDEVQGKLE